MGVGTERMIINSAFEPLVVNNLQRTMDVWRENYKYAITALLEESPTIDDQLVNIDKLLALLQQGTEDMTHLRDDIRAERHSRINSVVPYTQQEVDDYLAGMLSNCTAECPLDVANLQKCMPLEFVQYHSAGARTLNRQKINAILTDFVERYPTVYGCYKHAYFRTMRSYTEDTITQLKREIEALKARIPTP